MNIANLGEQLNPLRLVKHFVAPTIAGVILAFVLEFFKLLNAEPKAAIEMLSRWGPGVVLGTIALLIFGGYFAQMIEVQRDGVAAQHHMAEAMSKIAEKDDRQIQEIQTLAAYSAQRNDQLMDRLKEQAEDNRRNMARIEEHLQHIADELRERPKGASA